MDGTGREMTLEEWVDKLPETHSARKELSRLTRERDMLARECGERYVLGEGYGVGKGVLSDGENVGKFAWVGLTTEPKGTIACPLTFPNTSRIVNGEIERPKERRKFRLVLEVIEQADAAGVKVEG